MKIGPKYKIARRLNAPIFDKTQTQKFKLYSERKSSTRSRPATSFGGQLIEKQKARFTYGVSERQFSKYAKAIINKKITKPHERLYTELESRLDNVAYRIGLGTTRAFARQLVSHGHIQVNGKRIDIPSYKAKKGDVISIREGSQKKPVFQDVNERLEDRQIPAWIEREKKELKWTVKGEPTHQPGDLLFDLNAVIQFYKR